MPRDARPWKRITRAPSTYAADALPQPPHLNYKRPAACGPSQGYEPRQANTLSTRRALHLADTARDAGMSTQPTSRLATLIARRAAPTEPTMQHAPLPPHPPSRLRLAHIYLDARRPIALNGRAVSIAADAARTAPPTQRARRARPASRAQPLRLHLRLAPLSLLPAPATDTASASALRNMIPVRRRAERTVRHAAPGRPCIRPSCRCPSTALRCPPPLDVRSRGTRTVLRSPSAAEPPTRITASPTPLRAQVGDEVARRTPPRGCQRLPSDAPRRISADRRRRCQHLLHALHRAPLFLLGTPPRRPPRRPAPAVRP